MDVVVAGAVLLMVVVYGLLLVWPLVLGLALVYVVGLSWFIRRQERRSSFRYGP